MRIEGQENETAPTGASTESTTAAPAAGSDEGEADFEAGFQDEGSQENPSEGRSSSDSPAETATATDSPPGSDGEPAKPEPILFAGLTESQIKAALAAASEVPDLKKQITAVHDKAFGRMGEIQQALKDLRTNPATGAPKTITAAALKRTVAEYPEIAELLAEDLSSIVLQAPAAEAAPPLDLSAFEKAIERKLLTTAHRDWEKLRDSDDFRLWKTTLPPEALNVLNTTYDSETLIEAFDDFKAWRTKAQQAKAEAEATTAGAKQSRLEAAVAPRGSAAASETPDEDKAFEQGFNS